MSTFRGGVENFECYFPSCLRFEVVVNIEFIFIVSCHFQVFERLTCGLLELSSNTDFRHELSRYSSHRISYFVAILFYPSCLETLFYIYFFVINLQNTYKMYLIQNLPGDSPQNHICHRYAGTEINTRWKWNAIESIFRIVYAFGEQEAEARNSRKNIKHSLMAIWSLLIYYEWTNGMLSEIISAISLLPLAQSVFHQR